MYLCPCRLQLVDGGAVPLPVLGEEGSTRLAPNPLLLVPVGVTVLELLVQRVAHALERIVWNTQRVSSMQQNYKRFHMNLCHY